MSLIKVSIYSTETGKSPFLEWLYDLDTKTRTIIRSRIDRVSLGNFGDSKPIKGVTGLRELRINHGPGYRVYFGLKGMTVILILLGGDKSSQQRDITKAKEYWLRSRKLLDE